MRLQKNLDLKKILGPEQNFGMEKNLGPEKNLGLEKNLGPQKNLGPETVAIGGWVVVVAMVENNAFSGPNNRF